MIRTDIFLLHLFPLYKALIFSKSVAAVVTATLEKLLSHQLKLIPNLSIGSAGNLNLVNVGILGTVAAIGAEPHPEAGIVVGA